MDYLIKGVQRPTSCSKTNWLLWYGGEMGHHHEIAEYQTLNQVSLEDASTFYLERILDIIYISIHSSILSCTGYICLPHLAWEPRLLSPPMNEGDIMRKDSMYHLTQLSSPNCPKLEWGRAIILHLTQKKSWSIYEDG